MTPITIDKDLLEQALRDTEFRASRCADHSPERPKALARADAIRSALDAGAVEPVVTDEMVRAYLGANKAYWFEHDKMPPPIGKWCEGTVADATNVSLKAALSLYTTPPAPQAPTLPEGCLWAVTKGGHSICQPPQAQPEAKCASKMADESLDLLAEMFDLYEDGPDCYEDPDECAGYVGKAVLLDDTTVDRIVALLNKHRPRVTAAPVPQDKEN